MLYGVIVKDGPGDGGTHLTLPSDTPVPRRGDRVRFGAESGAHRGTYRVTTLEWDAKPVDRALGLDRLKVILVRCRNDDRASELYPFDLHGAGPGEGESVSFVGGPMDGMHREAWSIWHARTTSFNTAVIWKREIYVK